MPAAEGKLPGAVDEIGWPAGGAQCTAPHAESEVMVVVATAKGFCGSRGSSRCIGTRLESEATGADGLSKTGRLLGAHAATCV